MRVTVVTPNNVTKPVGYRSDSLTSADRVFDTGQSEYLAILWVVSFLRRLEGCPHTVWAEHDLVNWMLNLSDIYERLTHGHFPFPELQFDIGSEVDLKPRWCQRSVGITHWCSTCWWLWWWPPCLQLPQNNSLNKEVQCVRIVRTAKLIGAKGGYREKGHRGRKRNLLAQYYLLILMVSMAKDFPWRSSSLQIWKAANELKYWLKLRCLGQCMGVSDLPDWALALNIPLPMTPDGRL